MDEKLYKWLKHSDRFNEFVLCEDRDLKNGAPFDEMFDEESYDCVQLYDTTLFPIVKTPDLNEFNCDEWDIVGFAGQFSWDGNDITPLDGDIYYKDMIVLGYEFYTNEEYDIKRGLNILVSEW